MEWHELNDGMGVCKFGERPRLGPMALHRNVQLAN